MKFIDPDGRSPSKAQIAALLAWAKADAAEKEIEEPDPPKKDNNSLLSIYFNRLLGAVGLSPDQWNSDDPAVLEDASQRRKATINTIDAFNETTLSFIPLGEVGYKAYRGKEISGEDIAWEAAAIVPAGKAVKGINTVRGLWKLTTKGSTSIKSHSKFGTLYKSASDGLWWSTDKAGHGGSAFKVFRETKDGLEWYRDADKYGDFIVNKHKGDVGRLIPWSQLKTAK